MSLSYCIPWCPVLVSSKLSQMRESCPIKCTIWHLTSLLASPGIIGMTLMKLFEVINDPPEKSFGNLFWHHFLADYITDLLKVHILVLLFCTWLPSFPKTICWRDIPFFIVYLCLLCQEQLSSYLLGWFLGSQFFSIDLYVYFYPQIVEFWLLFALWSMGAWYLLWGGLMWFHTNFSNMCSIFLKNAFELLIRIVMNL